MSRRIEENELQSGVVCILVLIQGPLGREKLQKRNSAVCLFVYCRLHLTQFDCWLHGSFYKAQRSASPRLGPSLLLNRKDSSWVRTEGACVTGPASEASSLFTCWRHMTPSVSPPSVTAAAVSRTRPSYKSDQCADCCVGRGTGGPRSWVTN